MKNIKKQIVISGIVGLCVSGLLTNGFCIYVSLVFNDNDDLVNRVLFIISGVVLAVVLSIQSHSTFNRMKHGETTVRHVLRETVRVAFLSALWIMPFWMAWAWII